MQTKTMIQSQANVLRITEIQKGNVIKMVEKDYSGTKILFGVVTDLMNSGENTFIQLLLFERSYGDIKGKVKIYSGDEDLALFPATVEEVKNDMGAVLPELQKKVEKAKEDLANQIHALEEAESFISGETAKKLTEASFVELTMPEYAAEKKAKQIAAIKEA